MRVVVRADASLAIGTGHVMRCLTLASALRERGAEVSFVCREHEGHLCDLIAARGFDVTRLAYRPATQAARAERELVSLGTSWHEDAAATRQVTGAWRAKPDLLVVDHYALDNRWERAVRPSVSRMLVIDDLADRAHDCDLLLDQNLAPHMANRYDGKVNDGCALLLGPAFALLQPQYAELRDRTLPREGPVRRILVSFGGSDPVNLTGRIIACIIALGRPDVAVDVVVGSSNPFREAIRAQVVGRPQFVVHDSVPSLASLMTTADLAIGAAGTTAWERLCLGLPSLVVSLAENQRPIARALHERGLIEWLGHEDDVDDRALLRGIATVLEAGLSREWSTRCRDAVDGYGVSRVCDALGVDVVGRLCARRATLADEAQLLEWANDPVTRQNAFSQAPIALATHQAWYRKRLQDWPRCHMYVIESDERGAVGQVRFERGERMWTISYVVAPAHRGRGYGRRVMATALAAFDADEPGADVIGIVKRENVASRRIFEGLGFHQARVREGLQFRRARWFTAHV
jgi:UDP-2,4-diacetamido-2,4,6-trideoxy-beta-L-altropyranose hydrolase